MTAALDRLATGAFARCDVCGVQISDRRLRLAPATGRCINHLLVNYPNPHPDRPDSSLPTALRDRHDDPAGPDNHTPPDNDGCGDDRDV